MKIPVALSCHTNRVKALFTILFICITACKQKETCPAFTDDQFTSWFPYHAGQMLYFQSGAGNTDSFKIREATQSPVYEITRRFFSGGGRCEATAKILTDYSVNSSLVFAFEATRSKYAETEYSLSSTGYYLSFNNITDTGITMDMVHYAVTHFTQQQILNGTNYGPAQEITFDTLRSSRSRLSKIWIAKNKGVIGYQNKQSGAIFTLQ